MALLTPAIEPDTQGQVAAWNELRPVLHAEVERLPDRYRLPVILSYLEGKTNEEVAELLKWPVGTVKGRLSRARELLRSRLIRRGLSLSAAFLVTAISKGTVFAEVVSADMIESTTRRASNFRFDPIGPQPDSSMAIRLMGRIANVGRLCSGRGISERQRFIRRALVVLVFSIVSFSTSIGISLAVSEPGNSWGLRKVFSALHLAPADENDALCH